MAQPAGLVAAYGFDEGTGTSFADYSGSGNGGSIGGATWTSAGKSGGALVFDGSARAIVADSNSLDLTTGMTLEAWVYPTATPADYGTVVFKEQSSELVYDLVAENPQGKPEAYIYPGQEQGITGPSALPLNTWTHLASTYDGATMRLFVNGTQVVSASLPGTLPQSTGVLSIGGNSIWGEYFTGRIDEMRIYNRALTSTELQADMNTPIQAAGNTAPAIGTIVNQSIAQNSNTGALAFTIGDAETGAASLNLSGTSSNTTLVPNANIVFGGSGTSRTVTVTPASGQTGTSTITVTVSDGALTASDTFFLTVITGQTSGVVAAYSFDEGSGTTFADFSGNGNGGSIGGATWTASGKSGGALVFNGSARAIVADSNSLDLTTGMTLEAWVYPTATPADYGTVVFKEQISELVYDLVAENPQGKPEAYIYPGDEQGITGSSALPLNTWTHLASTYDGATMRLFVNGTQVVSASLPGSLPQSTGVLSIGGNSIWGEYFTGRIDEVRIYNRPLAAAELQADMTIPVNVAAAPVITSELNKTSGVGGAFSYQIAASNNPTSYDATGLPAGLGVNTATGLINGTPSLAGTSNVTISATNGSTTATATLTIIVNPAAPVITSATSTSGQVGVFFNYQIAATSSPIGYLATGLPDGIMVSTVTGVISGIPTTAATSTMTIGATNAGGTGNAAVTIDIFPAPPPAPEITSGTSANAQVGSAFSYQITATNNPATYSATGLPAGLSVNTTTGAITGTPTAAGTSDATIAATNAGGTGIATLSFSISLPPPPAPLITSATTQIGQVGLSLTYQITATNGPTSYGAAGLPAGLSVNTATGAITGVPTTAGSTNATISATNAAGIGGATLGFTINPAPPVITSATSATGQVGSAFSYQIAATNSPAAFDATPLPPGLTVDTTTGVISGTPTAAATTNVTVSATNSGGTGSAILNIAVSDAANIPPTVTLTAPVADTVFTMPNAIDLAATASDPDGTITKVEFFNGSTKVGESLTPPYSMQLTPVAPGLATLTARATDDLGAISTSASITIRILPTIPYAADFESAEGYTIGNADDQLGWSVSAGSAQIVGSSASHGTQSLVLSVGSTAAQVDQQFGPGATNPPIVFVDFFTKPVAGTDETAGTVFDFDAARDAFVLNGANGQFTALDGDGNGSGVWKSVPPLITLDSNNTTTTWQRVTVRLNYAVHKWDLYINGQLAAYDLGFRLNTPSYLGWFSLKGHAAASASLDDFFASSSNPIFADVNNDGIDDAWEVAHGLSLATDNRYLDADGDGATTLQEFSQGTDPTDYFNGVLPVITSLVIGGTPGAQGLVSVKVTRASDGAVLTNAPVTLSVSGTTSQIASSPGGPLGNSIAVHTDASGVASGFVTFVGVASDSLIASVQSGGQTATLSIAIVPPIVPPPNSGIRLWLKAEAGTTVDVSGNVSTWADQSGMNNNAQQATYTSYRPQLVANAVSGKPVVRFDGTNDQMSLPNLMSGASAGEVFVMWKANGTVGVNNYASWTMGTGGYSIYPMVYGQVYEAFGSTSRYQFDPPAGTLSTFHLYDVSSKAGEWVARFNGNVGYASASNTFGFPVAPLLGGNFQGDIAELLIYDHVLTSSERETVGQYFTAKYAPAAITVPAVPTSLVATAVSPTAVSLAWTPPAVSTSVIYTIERKSGAGSYAQIAEVADNVGFQDTGLTTGQSYSYKVKARTYAGSSGYSSEASATTLSGGTELITSGLRLWLDAGRGVQTTAQGVLTWLDQSGLNNNARQATYTSYRPQLVANAVSGKPVVHFDGTNDQMSLPNLMTGASAGEVFVMWKANGTVGANSYASWTMGTGGYSIYPMVYGQVYEAFGSTSRYQFDPPAGTLSTFHLYDVSSKAGEWVARFNGNVGYASASNTFGFPVAPLLGGNFQGDIAELLIYDHVLTSAERFAVMRYLFLKFGGAVAPFVSAIQDPGGDADGDGLTNYDEVYVYGTDPSHADTDGDGVPDGWEIAHGFNPNFNDAATDTDGDGMSDYNEWLLGRSLTNGVVPEVGNEIDLQVFTPVQ